jgi:hypothetical protein
VSGNGQVVLAGLRSKGLNAKANLPVGGFRFPLPAVYGKARVVRRIIRAFMSEKPQKSDASDYSKTLHLAQTGFPMRAGLLAAAPEAFPKPGVIK